jgi:hypothetical protein
MEMNSQIAIVSPEVTAGVDGGSRLGAEWELRQLVIDKECARAQQLEPMRALCPPARFECFKKYVDWIANGGRVKQFLEQEKVTWDFVSLYHLVPGLWSIYEEARTRAEEFKQRLREDEADRRGVEGDLRTRYDKDGNVTQEEQVYSDTLLITQLKAGDPERYADRSKVEHKGVVLNVDLTGLRSKGEA